MLRGQVKAFCERTSIHGFSHVVDSSHSWITKIVWLVAVTFSLIYAGISIRATSNDWMENPTKMVLETTSYPLEKVPFPSVTICDESPDPDKWILTMKLLDHFKMQCYDDQEGECNELQLAFRNVFLKNIKVLRKIVESYFMGNTQQEIQIHFKVSKDILDILKKIGKNNETSKIALEHLQKAQTEPFKTEHHMTDIENTLKTYADNLDINEIICSEDCKELTQKLLKEYVFLQQIEIAKGPSAPSGQFLAFHLGKYFGYNPLNGGRDMDIVGAIKNPFSGITYYEPSEAEINIQKYFLALAIAHSQGQWENMSILDIPASASKLQAFYEFRSEIPLSHFSILSKTGNMTKSEIRKEFDKVKRPWKSYITNHSKTFPPTSKYFNFTPTLDTFDTFLASVKECQAAGNQNLRDIAGRVLQPLRSEQDVDILKSNANKALACLFNADSEADILSEDCNVLEPTLTTNGLCQAFNALNPSDVWQDAKVVTKMAQDTFYNYPKNVFNGGTSAGLQMYLNLKPYDALSKSIREFNIGIKPVIDQFEQKRNIIKVVPGYHTSIKIIPEVTDTSDAFADLDLETRKCKLKHEIEGFSFLKTYTQNGCEFECAAKKAAEVCKCLPWFYPNNFTLFPICEMFGANCFDSIMTNQSYYKNCPNLCLENCQYVSYMVLPVYVPLDAEKICKTTFRFWIMIANLKTKFQEPFQNGGEGDSCERYVKLYLARVSVETLALHATKSKRDKRMSVMEELSSIGGTLGLFAGISILSIFEALCFLFTAFMSILNRK